MQDGENAIAIGTNAVASGKASIALGNEAKTYGNRSVAIGDAATANNELDVALGAGSSTEKTVATESINIAGQTHPFAGTSPVATVSIGSKGKERTLTNVAAGRVTGTSTDAINGSQFYAATQSIDFVNQKTDSNKVAIDTLETHVETSITSVKNEVKQVDGKVGILGSGTASAFGGGAKYDVATGKLSSPVFVVQAEEHNNVGSALDALDGQISNHSCR